MAIMSDHWDPAFIKQLPLFEVLNAAYNTPWRTYTDWPKVTEYNNDAVITNYNGQLIQFIPQTAKSQEFTQGYEPSIYLRGEVLTRAYNWHDFFNRLVWLTFPKIKATLNYWQYHLLRQRLPAQKNRTPLENKLTHLDENGIIVISCNPHLIELLKAQHWQELFWQQRAAVQTDMQFFIIGHALYEKALQPYIGMTGSALIFEQSADFFAQDLAQKVKLVDDCVSAWLIQQDNLIALKKLAPVPVLGIPGWWTANEARSFYDNEKYFRMKIKELQRRTP